MTKNNDHDEKPAWRSPEHFQKEFNDNWRHYWNQSSWMTWGKAEHWELQPVELADITPIDSLRHNVRFTLKNLAATNNHCKCPRCRNYTQSSMINLDNLCDRCESALDYWKKTHE